MVKSRFLVCLLTLFTAVACNDTSSPDTDRRITLRPVEQRGYGLVLEVPDTIYATRSRSQFSDAIEFSLNLGIRNFGPENKVLGFCGPSLQRKYGGEWHTVWMPVCLAYLPSPDILKAGYERTVPLRVWGSLLDNAGPAWEGFPVTGAYRFVHTAWSGTSNTPSPDMIESVYSNSFILIGPPE